MPDHRGGGRDRRLAAVAFEPIESRDLGATARRNPAIADLCDISALDPNWCRKGLELSSYIIDFIDLVIVPEFRVPT